MAATRKYYREDAQRRLCPQPKEFYHEGAKLAKLREAGSRSGHYFSCFSAPLPRRRSLPCLCVRSFFNGFQLDSSRTTSKRGTPEAARSWKIFARRQDIAGYQRRARSCAKSNCYSFAFPWRSSPGQAKPPGLRGKSFPFAKISRRIASTTRRNTSAQSPRVV